MNTLDDILSSSGARYGSFADNSKISQALKAAMRKYPSWEVLDDHMKEALEMIAHKIGRILVGDPSHADSWVDVAGYAKLVAKILESADLEKR